MWTDDGRTTEASHPISSPGAFGSGELKTNHVLTIYSCKSDECSLLGTRNISFLGKTLTFVNRILASKMNSRSPKCYLLLIFATLLKFYILIQEISWYKKMSGQAQHPQFYSRRPPVILKMWAKTPKFYKLFGLSQLCIHAKMVKFDPLCRVGIVSTSTICH